MFKLFFQRSAGVGVRYCSTLFIFAEGACLEVRFPIFHKQLKSVSLVAEITSSK